jgi:hypothetical protein
MLLDRGKLANYIGSDLAFEREYLGILRQTVQSCCAALSMPTIDIYKLLHGAKPGIVIATCAELSDLLMQCCDQTLLDSRKEVVLAPATLILLDSLYEQLQRLEKELGAILD